MTSKIFWTDPYLTHLDTAIDSVNGDEVTVLETIFYAESGGQESDFGTIGNHSVLQARKDGKRIVYTLAVTDHELKPGDPVSMEIDWARRYRLMRLHFAAEIVLELAYKKLDPIEKIGAHIAADKARIDFAWLTNIAEHLPDLSADANRIVDANQPIISAFSDIAAEKRYWEIEGLSRVPCGGTHLKTTGEIGAITLKRKNVGKGKERIEIFVSEG